MDHKHQEHVSLFHNDWKETIAIINSVCDMCLFLIPSFRNLSKNPNLTTFSWQVFEHLQLLEL